MEQTKMTKEEFDKLNLCSKCKNCKLNSILWCDVYLIIDADDICYTEENARVKRCTYFEEKK